MPLVQDQPYLLCPRLPSGGVVRTLIEPFSAFAARMTHHDVLLVGLGHVDLRPASASMVGDGTLCTAGVAIPASPSPDAPPSPWTIVHLGHGLHLPYLVI